MDDLLLERHGAVASIRMNRPPHNYFDETLLRGIADALAASDADPSIRATVLIAEGRSFCAGADFTAGGGGEEGARRIYAQAARLFDRVKPLVAAVGGAAVGGGLGLALAADLRVASPAARFHANFAAIGLHPGFALTATLPALLGAHRARDLLLTARRIGGEEALGIGLADRLVEADRLEEGALALAGMIAANAPLALDTIAAALPRTVDGAAARAAMSAELAAQARLFDTRDFREGVRATAERRPARFEGR